MSCASMCDCNAPGGHPHEPDCGSYRQCDEGRYCDKHLIEAEREHAWMAHVSYGAVTGVMSEKDEQDLRDAGRGHLLGERR